MLNNDIRLTGIYNAIQQKEISVLSIDIFDTLLWRRIPLPEDLFILLGQRLKQEGWLIDAVIPEVFADLRMKGARLARMKKSNISVTDKVGRRKKVSLAEVTLHEIYWELGALFKKITVEEFVEGKKGILNESDIDEPIAQEILYEKQLTEWDTNIVQLIQYAADAGIQVVLVSDTYFEKRHLIEILDRPYLNAKKPILSYISKIYPSCEYGVSKGGGLFDDMLKDLDIPAKKILHVGDNLKADVKAAQKAGLLASHYPKLDAELQEVLVRELSEDIAERKNYLDPQFGDFGLTALRSRVSFSGEIQQIPDARERFFWLYGARILGPITTAFAHWLYKRAQELGESKIYCMMRDGHLYAETLNRMAKCYPNYPLEPIQLWLSRRYVTSACVMFGNAEEVYSLLAVHPSIAFTLESFCQSLGIDVDSVKALSKDRYQRLNGELIQKKFAKRISSYPALRQQIVATATIRRKRLMKYLNSIIDLKNTKRILIADVGWIGTIQSALKMALAMEGFNIEVHGLYEGIYEKADIGLLRGSVREGYLLKCGQPRWVELSIRDGMYAFEVAHHPNTGSLSDIDDSGDVIIGSSYLPESQQNEIKRLQQGIYAFCDLYTKYRELGALNWDPSSETLIGQLQHILARCTSFPTRSEAIQFSPWMHQHSKDATTLQELGINTYYENFVKEITPSGLRDQYELLWTSIFPAKIDPHLSKALQQLIIHRFPMECLLSVDYIPLKLYLDHGEGFLKRAYKEVKLRSNPSRSYFSRVLFSSLGESVKRFLLTLDVSSMLVRIKSIRIVAYSKSSPDTIEMGFFEQESDVKGFTISGATQEDYNLFRCKEGPIKFAYTFSDPEIYYFKINFCCETFPV